MNKNKVEFIPLAKQTVLDYVQAHLDVTDDVKASIDDIYVV